MSLIIPPITNKKEGAEHILGSQNLPEKIINPSGDWTPFLPVYEPQSKNGFDTDACAIFGTDQAVEVLVFHKTGARPEYAKRYTANVAKNEGILTPQGSDPHKVAELVRNETGQIDNSLAPFADTIQTYDQYFSLDTSPLLVQGKEWYQSWGLAHKWLWV